MFVTQPWLLNSTVSGKGMILPESSHVLYLINSPTHFLLKFGFIIPPHQNLLLISHFYSLLSYLATEEQLIKAVYVARVFFDWRTITNTTNLWRKQLKREKIHFDPSSHSEFWSMVGWSSAFRLWLSRNIMKKGHDKGNIVHMNRSP